MALPLARLALLALSVLTGVAAYDAVSAQAGGAAGEPGDLAAHWGMADPAQARSDYIENCGGCHGVQGSSAPAQVPELRDRVGYFMCTPEARAYLLRLPNVAYSRVADNEELAELMNYVIFRLGGASVPKGTTPFTAQEVAHERQFALSSVSLTRERARQVRDVIRTCHAPASLALMYDGEAQHK